MVEKSPVDLQIQSAAQSLAESLESVANIKGPTAAGNKSCGHLLGSMIYLQRNAEKMSLFTALNRMADDVVANGCTKKQIIVDDHGTMDLLIKRAGKSSRQKKRQSALARWDVKSLWMTIPAFWRGWSCAMAGLMVVRLLSLAVVL